MAFKRSGVRPPSAHQYLHEARLHSAGPRSQAPSSSADRGSQPSCTMTTVPVADMTYYRCGPNWFQKAYTGGQVSFVVVAPPPGY